MPMILAVESVAEEQGPRRLRLRYPATCGQCGVALPKGSEALWDQATKEVTCLVCPTHVPGDREGQAGASAAAEGERRRERRVQVVRRRYGDRAAAVAKEMAGRDTRAAWGKGSDGESMLAAYVRREVGDSIAALHDRLIPGTRGNIDHLFIAPTGV